MILFLDDEINVLKSVERIFRIEKIKIFTTTDPTEAIELIKGNSVKIIISDFRMEKLNGIEFLKKVKLIQPSTYRMILSGYADENLINSAIKNEDIHEYVLKPFEHNGFVKKVKAIYEDRVSYGKSSVE